MTTSARPPVPLVPGGADARVGAQALARRWGLRLAEAADAPFYLAFDNDRVELRQSGSGGAGPVYVDFVHGAVAHRRRFGGGRGQPLARAVGLKGGRSPTVLDATAGLGRDAFVLATLGCEVVLVERSAVAGVLLEDGLRRAAEDAETAPIAARMRLVHADAVAWMRSLADEQRPAVVYIDPMFPPRGRSARVKKEMAAFQAVIGPDADSDALLEAALQCARERVVVKRPDDAEPLAGRSPTVPIRTRKHRFDVYVVKALAPA